MVSTPEFRTGHLEARLLPDRDREEIWRHRTAWHYQVSDLHLTAANEAHLYGLGAVTFTDVRHPSQTFTRDARLIRRDGADSILCSVQLDRPSPVYVDGVQVGGEVGRATFSDLARPLVKTGGPGRTLCVEVQRDALRTHLKDPGVLLATPGGGWRTLLAEHMRLLAADPSLITAATAGHIERSLVELVAACTAAPQAQEQARSVVEPLLRRRLIACIDQLLGDPDLSPEMLTQRLHVSRSSLYKLGAPAGGISALIRERRLQKAHEALRRAPPPSSIQSVAFATGFRSEAQFSRAFRRRFGLSPSEARAQARRHAEGG